MTNISSECLAYMLLNQKLRLMEFIPRVQDAQKLCFDWVLIN